MHAFHLYRRAAYCRCLYLYARPLVIQRGGSAMAMKLGVLRAGEFRFGSTLQTKKYQPRRVGMCGIGGPGGIVRPLRVS